MPKCLLQPQKNVISPINVISMIFVGGITFVVVTFLLIICYSVGANLGLLLYGDVYVMVCFYREMSRVMRKPTF